jgi:hypothetical protein
MLGREVYGAERSDMAAIGAAWREISRAVSGAVSREVSPVIRLYVTLK